MSFERRVARTRRSRTFFTVPPLVRIEQHETSAGGTLVAIAVACLVALNGRVSVRGHHGQATDDS